ncbi:MAG: hypothetical protein CR978_02185 [Gammaproteobacteria bacterium]|nr:MAG: hypothetical protein CR978_02185 [Gammaproteobacteria bacterium]
MNIEYDPDKNARNVEKHGIGFEQVRLFDFEKAVIEQDERFEYGEPRFNAFGSIGERMYVLTFTVRRSAVRVISLRKANKREVKRNERK